MQVCGPALCTLGNFPSRFHVSLAYFHYICYLTMEINYKGLISVVE